MKKSNTILVFAQNQRGVLERISMTIRKKMYNLEQITAGDSEIEGIKRLTISFSHEETDKLPQIINQLKKIVEVIDVKIVDQFNSFEREVALIKLKKPQDLSELLSLGQAFKSEIININEETVLIEITGDSQKINNFLVLLKPYQILELGRSGLVTMEK
jgi:acetolactate synthase I/III small subunit